MSRFISLKISCPQGRDKETERQRDRESHNKKDRYIKRYFRYGDEGERIKEKEKLCWIGRENERQRDR